MTLDELPIRRLAFALIFVLASFSLFLVAIYGLSAKIATEGANDWIQEAVELERSLQLEAVEKEKKINQWRLAMKMCESGDNASAINEVDLDGTPSIGLWQMKTGTFKWWVEKYDLFNHEEWDDADWENNIFSREHQEAIMDAVIADGHNINWNRQFPDCVSRYGPPPIT